MSVQHAAVRRVCCCGGCDLARGDNPTMTLSGFDGDDSCCISIGSGSRKFLNMKDIDGAYSLPSDEVPQEILYQDGTATDAIEFLQSEAITDWCDPSDRLGFNFPNTSCSGSRDFQINLQELTLVIWHSCEHNEIVRASVEFNAVSGQVYMFRFWATEPGMGIKVGTAFSGNFACGDPVNPPSDPSVPFSGEIGYASGTMTITT